MSEMRITDGKGVQFTYANGVTVSIQIGRGNYGDNYDFPDYEITRENPLPHSTKAEVAVWDMSGEWFELNGDQVAGYVPMDKVWDFCNYLRSLPNGVSAKNIVLDASALS